MAPRLRYLTAAHGFRIARPSRTPAGDADASANAIRVVDRPDFEPAGFRQLAEFARNSRAWPAANTRCQDGLDLFFSNHALRLHVGASCRRGDEARMSGSWIPVRIETEWLLLEAALIQEILGTEPWLAIPHTRSELPGVLAWRGRAVPLLDLAAVFGLSPLPPQSYRPRALVAQTERGFVAIPVDEAREVHALEPHRIRSAHAVEKPFSPSEAVLDGIVMAVLDLSALVFALTAGSTASGA